MKLGYGKDCIDINSLIEMIQEDALDEVGMILRGFFSRSQDKEAFLYELMGDFLEHQRIRWLESFLMENYLFKLEKMGYCQHTIEAWLDEKFKEFKGFLLHKAKDYKFLEGDDFYCEECKKNKYDN